MRSFQAIVNKQLDNMFDNIYADSADIVTYHSVTVGGYNFPTREQLNTSVPTPDIKVLPLRDNEEKRDFTPIEKDFSIVLMNGRQGIRPKNQDHFIDADGRKWEIFKVKAVVKDAYFKLYARVV